MHSFDCKTKVIPFVSGRSVFLIFPQERRLDTGMGVAYIEAHGKRTNLQALVPPGGNVADNGHRAALYYRRIGPDGGG